MSATPATTPKTVSTSGFGITWDDDGERFFEAGVERGVLFVKTSGVYGAGVAWNGLTSVSEAPEGGEANAIYADNIKYLNLTSREDFAGSISAYMYPPEFYECEGVKSATAGVYLAQQKRKEFGLTYTTRVGNDEDGEDHGYKIHIIWNALASPSSKDYSTTTDSTEPGEFSWDFTTTPSKDVPSGFKPCAYMVIDSRTVDGTKLTSFENTLYGTAGSGSAATTPSLPTPAAVVTALTASA